jgi:hypothetical protein
MFDRKILIRGGYWWSIFQAAFRIRKFLGLPDPDSFVRDTDPNPDPSTIKQKK